MAVLFAVLLTAPFQAIHAHEGHDHGPAETMRGPSAPRIAVYSDTYQLVAILNGERLVIYLDRFATNEPVTTANVAVTVGDAGEAVNAEPRPDGTYGLASPRFGRPGEVELVFSITGDGGDDLLIETLRIPQISEGDLGSTASASWRGWFSETFPPPQRIALSGIALLAFGVLGAYVLRKRRAASTAAIALAGIAALALLAGAASGHEGHDHAQDQPKSVSPNSAGLSTPTDAPRRLPDGSVFMPKPTQRLLELRTAQLKPEPARRAVNLIGRVIADPNRASLVQSINGGRVIAPDAGLPRIGQAVTKGELLAQIEPSFPLADRTTIAERVGEIEQLIAVAESKLRRVRMLVEKQVVPKSQLDDAEVELDGLRRRREVLRATRAEPEILRASTSGVIAAANVVPGQVVRAQDVLFRIVDAGSLWVEALVYGEIDPAALIDATAATPAGHLLKLRFQGFSRALRQHASLVQFAVDSPPANLAIGLPITVVAASGEPVTALIVPRDAVVRSANGEAIVWRHVEPERFESRPVRIAPLDATRVIVAAGVSEGDRVVVRAADLVNQVR